MLFCVFLQKFQLKNYSLPSGTSIFHFSLNFVERMEPHSGHTYLGRWNILFWFATFSASSAAVLKSPLPAASGAPFKPAITDAEVFIMYIPSTRKRKCDSVIFSARYLKKMNLASVARKVRGKQIPAFRSALKRHK